MVIAYFNGKRTRAEDAGSGAEGICPWSKLKVIAKVGEIRQYWAYVGGQPKFPEGYENETEWHYNWKFPIKDEYCEVVCGSKNEHRADIIGSNNIVIEIQKSPIDIRIVRERIAFYKALSNKRVIWIVEASDYWRERLKIQKNTKDKNYDIEWSYPRQWVVEIAKTTSTNLFLDFNESSELLFQMWVYQNRLKGQFILKENFFKKYLVENSKEEFKQDFGLFNQLWNINPKNIK